MKVLGAVRLSNDTDTTTSPEGQRAQIEAWAQSKGHEVVAWAEDTDVSARKIPPAKRPSLGPWLTSPRSDVWEILVCAKQDRLFRSAADFHDMTAWCVKHGKAWASVAENIDLSNAAGRMFGGMLAEIGQFEADRTGERCRESADRLAALGRWRGGKAPYGYVPQDTGQGWTLALDSATVGTVRQMAERAIAGSSNGQIARWLTATGVGTPRGGCSWTPEIVRVMLRSPALAGWSVRNGKIVRDAGGSPVMITAEPVLSADKWSELQAALDSRRQNHAERVGGHLLLGVAYCRQCVKPNGKPAPLYGHNAQGRSKMASNYRCQVCGYSVRKELLEATVIERVMQSIGAKPLPRKVTIPAISHTAELAEIDARMTDIEAEVASGDMPARSAGRMLATLEAKRDVLAAKPQRAAVTTWAYDTGQTVSQHWATLDSEARGRFLRTWEVRITADRKGYKLVTGWDDESGSFTAQAFGLSTP